MLSHNRIFNFEYKVVVSISIMTPNLGMLKNWLNSKLVAIFNPFQIIEIIQEPALKSNIEKLPLKVNE